MITSKKTSYFKQIFFCLTFLIGAIQASTSQISFSQSNLIFNGNDNVSGGVTGMSFGPDGRLYVVEYTGAIKILTINRNSSTDYNVTNIEELNGISTIQNHNDDGTNFDITLRETIDIVVSGTTQNPVFYVSSSDIRIGAGTNGGNGDVGLDTNSGVITRFSWNGTAWDIVDIVRGLPRSEENHATNGLQLATINGVNHLIVNVGGITNGGAPSTNFVFTCEYALSGAVISVDLDKLNALPILNDNGRNYIYDLPTLDDPTRPNSNGITDPDAPGYDGKDINDPFGGNDGLNMAIIVPNGPVQILSPGYRNAYGIVVTESGALYVTDNGANQGWGGFPENEGSANVTNDYNPAQPGDTSPSDGEFINNVDHLQLITNNLDTYVFNSFYGGHPNPVRANPQGAGLYTDNTSALGTFGLPVWRTKIYDPDGSRPNSTTNPNEGLPANWPPVQISNIVEGDWRGPGIINPDGPNDNPVVTWGTNTNSIDEYTASNFGGALKGNLLAGHNGGNIRRVKLSEDGSTGTLEPNFFSGIGGNVLGLTCNGDNDIFPGTVWAGTIDGKIVVMEPLAATFVCIQPENVDYNPLADYDSDGYTNQDEVDNGTDSCNGGSQPADFNKISGAPFISDRNDPDDDSDGIPDSEDPFQLGNPSATGSQSFTIPISNDLFNSQQGLGGIFGLGMTGLMNNGDTGLNWLNWIDRRDNPNDPNPNDVLGGAPGIMTSHMTSGTALGVLNSQEKAYQYGVQVDSSSDSFTIIGGMNGFSGGPYRLYGNTAAVGGELGFFIGDGTQSNYIKFVVTVDGFIVLQEIDDVPQTPISVPLAVIDRPANSIRFYLTVNPQIGSVTLEYSIDANPRVTVATVTAQGKILEALQLTTVDLAVGFIGTSGAVGVELEGSWDFLNIIGTKPVATLALPDVNRFIGANPESINLNSYFNDGGGYEALTYIVVNNTNNAIGATILNNILNLNFPQNIPATSIVTIRATDSNNNFVEQSFTINIGKPVVLYRVNAGGPEITSIDGDINWSADTAIANSTFLLQAGSNSTSSFAINSTAYSVDTNKIPISIFQTERYDSSPGQPNLTYAFPVAENGNYEVRLYMVNGYQGTSLSGQRIFNATIEDNSYPELSNIDLTSRYGHQVGVVISQIVPVNDGVINITLLHNVENPLINGIEILYLAGSGLYTPINVNNIANQTSFPGETLNGSLGVAASGGDPNANFVYSISGQPEGVNIEPTNGLIYGTIYSNAATGGPNGDGVHNVTVVVSKVGSSDVIITFDWSVSQLSCSWNNLSDSEVARIEVGSKKIGNKLFVFAGFTLGLFITDRTEIYDTTADVWSDGAPMPLPVTHMGTTVVGNEIWFIAGFVGDNPGTATSAVQIYNTVTDSWSIGPDLPAARGSGAAAFNGNKIHFFGGLLPDRRTDTGDHFVLDLANISAGWTTLAPLPNPRNHLSAETVNGLIYAIGGQYNHDGPVTDTALLHVYDPTTNQWTRLADLPDERSHFEPGTTIHNGNIIIVGGRKGEFFFDEVTLYNPQLNLWSQLCTLPEKLLAPAAQVFNNRLIIATGGVNGIANASAKTRWLQLEGGVTENRPILVNEIANQTSFPGEVLNGSFGVAVTGGDGNLKYTAVNLPPGIFIEPTNGQIGGTVAMNASTVNPYNVVITVDDSDGESSDNKTVSFQWTIVANSLWIDKNENENYTARHENSFVQAGNKFYLMGGRENATTIDVYDYTSNTWTVLPNSAPFEFNHFQATEYKGLIWVIGAFQTNLYPTESPAEYIWSFDPSSNEWIQGPQIPVNRRRGSAGLAVYNDKFYILAGNTNGHDGGYVNWFDEYNPATGTWTALTDAPRARDHFHTTVIGNKLYAVGGRLSGGEGGVFKPVISQVDVYDFTSSSWSTLPSNQNLPTPRAAAMVANYNGKLLVIGGEVQNEIVYGVETDNALKITEQYDPATQTWSRLADLNYERHGTQAIVSGNGIFTLAGSPDRGGGNQKNMEVFGTDIPVGNAIVASNLSAPTSIEITGGNTKQIILQVSGGNVGKIIRSMQFTGPNAADFSIVSGLLTNALLNVNSAHNIVVQSNNNIVNKSAILTISYGASSSILIAVTSGPPPVNNFVLRLNAGGPAVTHNGILFEADKNFTGGGTYVNNLAQVPDLYRTERSSSSQVFGYNIPLPNGDYTAVLHFAEIYWGATGSGSGPVGTGRRKFDVTMEGVLILDNYDIFAEVGAQTAVTKSYPVTVTDGILNLSLSSLASVGGLDQPKLSALEILGNSNLSVNQSPVAVANATPVTGTAPLAVNFTGNNSTDDVAITSYIWNFGDGSPTVNTITPSHTFTTTGVYNVLLTVQDAAGLTDTSTVIITVVNPTSNQSPVAVATATPLTGTAPLAVNFTGSNSTDDEAITGYLWDFGDGSASVSVPNPTHTYTSLGTYIAVLTVTDAGGLQDTKNVVIAVTSGSPPVNNFVLRLNAGGPAVTHNGILFEADKNFTGGNSYSNNLAQVSELYQSERSSNSQVFGYNIPVPNGDYTVILHFAEIYWGASGTGSPSNGTGRRIFDVTMEGNLILDNYYIFAEVGAQTATTKSYSATVTDGVLNLSFSALASVGGVDQPKLSGLEIIGSGSSSSAKTKVTNSNSVLTSSTLSIDSTIDELQTNSTEIRLFPNPANTELQIVVGTDYLEINFIQLFEISGRLVSIYNAKEVSVGVGHFKFNVEGLKEGSYIINCIATTGKSFKKQVLIKK